MTRFLIVLVYVVLAGFFIFIAYQISSPTNPDQMKEFGVIAGLALAVLGTFTGMLVTFSTLSAQKTAARQLETLKNELAGKLEAVKHATSVKSQAYTQVCVAAIRCYRELQHLAEGKFDKTKVEAAQQSLTDAEGSIFNLDEATQQIVQRIIQRVFDIIDSAEDTRTKTPPNQLATEYQKIWNERARQFGDEINELKKHAPFSDIEIPK